MLSTDICPHCATSICCAAMWRVSKRCVLPAGARPNVWDPSSIRSSFSTQKSRSGAVVSFLNCGGAAQVALTGSAQGLQASESSQSHGAVGFALRRHCYLRSTFIRVALVRQNSAHSMYLQSISFLLWPRLVVYPLHSQLLLRQSGSASTAETVFPGPLSPNKLRRAAECCVKWWAQRQFAGRYVLCTNSPIHRVAASQPSKGLLLSAATSWNCEPTSRRLSLFGTPSFSSPLSPEFVSPQEEAPVATRRPCLWSLARCFLLLLLSCFIASVFFYPRS
jgi:hypothetical protein